jgi:hypothetical protein
MTRVCLGETSLELEPFGLPDDMPWPGYRYGFSNANRSWVPPDQVGPKADIRPVQSGTVLKRFTATKPGLIVHPSRDGSGALDNGSKRPYRREFADPA